MIDPLTFTRNDPPSLWNQSMFPANMTFHDSMFLATNLTDMPNNHYLQETLVDLCMQLSTPNEIFFQFITNGILLNLIGALGIVGNVLSMIILSRPQMRSSINYLLIGLARCDTVLILTSVLLFGIPSIYPYTGYLFIYYYYIYPHLAPVVYPLAMIAQTVSVYLTLTVTLERFVAVCHPLRARSLCTYGRAKFYVVAIIIFALVYNLPRYWEVSQREESHDAHNVTIYCLTASSLRTDPLYITVYIHWMYLVFIYFVPFSSLAILNTAIYRQVRKANAERQRLSRLQRREIGLATMLLCVVIVFFICNILPLVINLMETCYGIIIDQLVKISNLLVTINSSVNFIIYVIFGEKFKRIFFRIFCHRALARDSPDIGTHDDSFVSNGERQSLRLYRHNTSQLKRNGGSMTSSTMLTSSLRCKERQRSVRITTPPDLNGRGNNVYYPGGRPKLSLVPSTHTSVTILTNDGSSPTEWISGNAHSTGF